ncbi:hypothetical protein EPR50_G00242870 [Perca flavescens]|uniref:Uncharacterized protein n=1 Tax=Perca flavescens TaxID=8167 RepID=A0A484BXX2_PERFV|nr:hypothetical protein EPR50_G00242870 [Perca flavescens]
MELDSKEIVYVATIDKRQTNWNSNIMEKEGFIQTVDKLTKDLKVVEFCMDAHVQIGALLSTLDWSSASCLQQSQRETGSCQHDHLEDTQGKQWIERDSKSHKALVDIVHNKCWQKDVHKYLSFRSTAHLESFQNHILMYASKRQAFTPQVYDSRVVLAALDYNFHRERPTYRTAEGQCDVLRKKYNKNARRYSLYTVKCEKSYGYLPELQARILKGRVTSGVGMLRWRTLHPDDPRRLGVVPPIPPPPTSELVRTQVSRGLGSAFHAATNLEAD